jgi:hypothetical protein
MWRRCAFSIGVVAVVVAASALPASAADEPITGTAVTSGGDGASFQDWTYSSPGLLGTGTIHSEFTIDFSTTPFTTSGFNVLTRSDGATLSGTGTGTVDISQSPFVVTTTSIMGNGTGALSGVTAVIVLTGTISGPGSTGDVFTMSGTVTTGGGGVPLVGVGPECDGDVGLIVVTISDDSDFTYDIFVDGELIDSDVPIDGEEDLVIEVPDDGSYFVEVDWVEAEATILNETVAVDCAPDETTTPTVPASPAPVAEAVVAQPEFTG